jgi:hypothetical protein
MGRPEGGAVFFYPRRVHMSSEQEIFDQIDNWRYDPLAWVADVFDGKIKLSKQQANFFLHLVNLIRFKIEAAEGVVNPKLEKYRGKIGISIMAGRGVGKDFITALTILWFSMVWPGARVLATGVTGKHLRSVLWAEIGKLMTLSRRTDPKDTLSPTFLSETFEWQTERISHTGDPTVIIEAVTINNKSSDSEQAQALSGRHADYMLICVDEADAVPRCVLENLEPTMTGKVNLALMIFNPMSNTSYAVCSHTDEAMAEKWVKLRWNGEESEIVSRDFIEGYKKYGEESNVYRVNVLGLPPLADDGGLIPWVWLVDAKNRDFDVDTDPIIFGVDVSGGGDRSVICVRQGNKVLYFKKSNVKDQMDLADWIFTEMESEGAVVAALDIVGLGQGCYDRLRQMGANVRPYDSRNRAQDANRYYNKRSESYCLLREMFQDKRISIPDDDDLLKQLASIKIDHERKNLVEDKRSIRKRLGGSPDEADSLSIAFSLRSELFRKQIKKKSFKTRPNWRTA